MTLLRLGFRLQLIGAISVTGLGGLNGFFQTSAFAQLVGPTPAERAVFAAQMGLLARQLSYILPIPSQLDTMAGYVAWRVFGFMPVLLAFWAVIAGTGAARGDEERGLVELVLASGIARTRWLAGRVLAFVLVAIAVSTVMLLATELGAALAGEAIAGQALAAEGAAMVGLALGVFGIALLCSQLLATRRAAAGLSAVVVLVLFLLNSAGRTVDVGTVRWLSPFYSYERSTPLLKDGALDLGATGALVIAGLALAALAAGIFARRDLGAALIAWGAGRGRPTARPSSDPLLRIPVLAAIDQQRVWIASWAVALAAIAIFLTSLTRAILDAMTDIPSMRPYLQQLGITSHETFVGAIWFGTAVLILSIYVIVQVNSWVADDAEGRLEAVLAAPVSRARVVLERLGTVLVATAVIVAASSLATYLTAQASDIVLDSGRLAVASALMLSVVLAFAALGHAVVGWQPRAAVIALSVVAAVSYFTQQLGPVFDWPEWVRNLSLYVLYGTPLSKGVDWLGLVTLLAISAVGTVVSVATMRRRDVGT